MYDDTLNLYKSDTPQQAAEYLVLAAFAKWVLTNPLGSLPAGMNQEGEGV